MQKRVHYIYSLFRLKIHYCTSLALCSDWGMGMEIGEDGWMMALHVEKVYSREVLHEGKKCIMMRKNNWSRGMSLQRSQYRALSVGRVRREEKRFS